MYLSNRSWNKALSFCIIAFAVIILCLRYEPKVIFDNHLISNHQYTQFEDYAQNVFLLKKILVKDNYLNSINESGKILDFKNGTIEIKSEPLVK